MCTKSFSKTKKLRKTIFGCEIEWTAFSENATLMSFSKLIDKTNGITLPISKMSEKNSRNIECKVVDFRTSVWKGLPVRSFLFVYL